MPDRAGGAYRWGDTSGRTVVAEVVGARGADGFPWSAMRDGGVRRTPGFMSKEEHALLKVERGEVDPVHAFGTLRMPVSIGPERMARVAELVDG